MKVRRHICCQGLRRKFWFIMVLSTFFNSHLFAQSLLSENSITEQIWVDYNPSIPLNYRVSLYGDIGFRTLHPHEWNRIVIRPSIRYKIPKFFWENMYYKAELHGGVGFFLTNNLDLPNRVEIRPFQGLRLAWPNRPHIRLRHYVRLEERFDIETPVWQNTFGLRLRYQAEITLRFSGDFIRFNKGLYLPVSMEFFWNLIGVKQFNDAVRIIPGVGYEFSSTWKGEFQLGYQYTRNTLEDNFATNDIVARIRVYHVLSKNKDEK